MTIIYYSYFFRMLAIHHPHFASTIPNEFLYPKMGVSLSHLEPFVKYFLMKRLSHQHQVEWYCCSQTPIHLGKRSGYGQSNHHTYDVADLINNGLNLR